MKKVWIWGLLLTVLMTGCANPQTFETLGPETEMVPPGQPLQIVVMLPDEMAVPVMEDSAGGKLYMGRDYTLTLYTGAGGDLSRTLAEHTGYAKDALCVMHTVKDGVKRYDGVWSAAGEGTEQVGRIAVLDDGTYHYVMTVMADADSSGALQQTWQELFDSFRLVDPQTVISTGS